MIFFIIIILPRKRALAREEVGKNHLVQHIGGISVVTGSHRQSKTNIEDGQSLQPKGRQTKRVTCLKQNS
jgi:hypothetical protein